MRGCRTRPGRDARSSCSRRRVQCCFGRHQGRRASGRMTRITCSADECAGGQPQLRQRSPIPQLRGQTDATVVNSRTPGTRCDGSAPLPRRPCERPLDPRGVRVTVLAIDWLGNGYSGECQTRVTVNSLALGRPAEVAALRELADADADAAAFPASWPSPARASRATCVAELAAVASRHGDVSRRADAAAALAAATAARRSALALVD